MEARELFHKPIDETVQDSDESARSSEEGNSAEREANGKKSIKFASRHSLGATNKVYGGGQVIDPDQI